jgi:peptidoglycan/LPS O-acetylase OafA/YrhL
VLVLLLRCTLNKATSIYLDFVRILAAASVFFSHASYGRFTGGIPLMWRFQGRANDSVMIFFVLSGLVIAYVSDKKEKTPKDYMMSRLARLYSVVAPALLLTILLDYIGSHVAYSVYAGHWFQTDHPVWRFLSNLFFVNELWFSSIQPFSNGPFWSLGYEFWYYVIYAVAYYYKPSLKYVVIAGLCLIAGPKILILLPIWLLGVWTYFRIKTRPVAEPVGIALVIGTIAAYLIFRHYEFHKVLLDWTIAHFGGKFVNDQLGYSDLFLSDYLVGALVALNFVGMASVVPRLSRAFDRLERPIRYVAGYTFATYLFHYPLLQFFAAITSGLDKPFLRYMIIFFGTIGVIWGLGTITERKKSALKKLLLSVYEAIA